MLWIKPAIRGSTNPDDARGAFKAEERFKLLTAIGFTSAVCDAFGTTSSSCSRNDGLLRCVFYSVGAEGARKVRTSRAMKTIKDVERPAV